MNFAVLELDDEHIEVRVLATVRQRAAADAFAHDERTLRSDRGHRHLRVAGLEQAPHWREEIVDDGLPPAMRPLPENAPHLHLPDGVLMEAGADLLQVAGA